MVLEILKLVKVLKLSKVPKPLTTHSALTKRKVSGIHPRIQQGFTLLELLVVMVIIGLLASYVGPRYFAQVGKSEVKTTRVQLDALGKALDQYRLDTGHYPTTEQSLSALVTAPANEPRWDGPYLKKNVPPDPWGNAYAYKQPGDHSEYDLLSYGNDGQPGGSGQAADIVNW